MIRMIITILFFHPSCYPKGWTGRDRNTPGRMRIW